MCYFTSDSSGVKDLDPIGVMKDDILVYESNKDHHLKEVLKTIIASGLKLKGNVPKQN